MSKQVANSREGEAETDELVFFISKQTNQQNNNTVWRTVDWKRLRSYVKLFFVVVLFFAFKSKTELYVKGYTLGDKTMEKQR